jgi:hypothetical protein
MVVMYNGWATNSDRVMMQWLRWVNIIHSYMMLHSVLPNIVCIHKRIKIKMDDRSKPLHKFTDLCRKVMCLSSTAADGTSKPLSKAIIPIVLRHQQGSAIITYRTNNIEAASLIWKLRRSVAGWFFGYWINVMHCRLEMVQKLMESFDVDAALLTCFSKFDPAMLTITTTFGDVNKQLKSVKADLGIDQGWYTDLKGESGNKVDVVGHRKVLAMTLHDRIKDVDNAMHSRPSCKSTFCNQLANQQTTQKQQFGYTP